MAVLLRLILTMLLLAAAEARRLGFSWGVKEDNLQVIRPDDFKLFRFFDFYGASVSLSGNTLIIGANFASNGGTGIFGGIAYIFVRNAVTGDWSEEARLKPPGELMYAPLSSWHVDLDGDTAIVGSLMDSEFGTWAGAAYIYVRNAGVWTMQQKLMAEMPVPYDYFGLKVLVDESVETAVVASQYGDQQESEGGFIESSGKVYVFLRTGTTWSLQQTLQASDPSQFAKFGSSIAIEGDNLVVGSPSDEAFSPGAIYFFTRTAGVWTEQVKIVPTDLGERGNFGDSVSISGNTIAAGDWGNNFVSGAVYVFTGSGSTWTQQQKITSDKFHPGEFYSWSISLEGDTLVASGWFNNFLRGSAYIYTRTAGVWSTKKVVGGHTPFGLFGSSVSLDNGNLAIGAMMEGAAYYLDSSNI